MGVKLADPTRFQDLLDLRMEIRRKVDENRLS